MAPDLCKMCFSWNFIKIKKFILLYIKEKGREFMFYMYVLLIFFRALPLDILLLMNFNKIFFTSYNLYFHSIHTYYGIMSYIQRTLLDFLYIH